MRKYILTMLYISALVAVPFICILIWVGFLYFQQTDIRNYGVRENAKVSGFENKCGRHDCAIWVKYIYLASDNNSNIIKNYAGKEIISDNTNESEPEYLYAKTYSQVKIAYSYKHPYFSSLNFDDEAFRDRSGGLIAFIKMIAVVYLGIFVALGIIVAAKLMFDPKYAD